MTKKKIAKKSYKKNPPRRNIVTANPSLPPADVSGASDVAVMHRAVSSAPSPLSSTALSTGCVSTPVLDSPSPISTPSESSSESSPSPPRKKSAPRRLGRGLSVLLGVAGQEIATDPAVLSAPQFGAAASPLDQAIQWVDIAAISSLPGQPRRYFGEDSIGELADSIRHRGVLQPVILRPSGRSSAGGERYQIVAGERRWRAAQRAGLHRLPALVRRLDDAATLEIALVENIQRQDLNAIEEAHGYRRLGTDYGHSQQEIARLVGKSRSHIANLMRLLDLPSAVQAMVIAEEVTMGHARALIGYDKAEALAQQIVREGLTVRKVEDLVRHARRRDGSDPTVSSVGDATDQKRTTISPSDRDVAMLVRDLEDALGVGVSIRYRADGKRGTLALQFTSLEQIDMLCARLQGTS